MTRVYRFFTACTLASGLLFASTTHAFAAQIGVQNLTGSALLGSLIAVGGGEQHFSAATLRTQLEQGTQEDRALRTSLGSAAVDQFDTVFTYVVHDAIRTMRRSSMPLHLHQPTPLQPRELAEQLYDAGLSGTSFDIEKLFDTIFTSQIHDHAMIAVARKYGASGETAYHSVLKQLIIDLGTK